MMNIWQNKNKQCLIAMWDICISITFQQYIYVCVYNTFVLKTMSYAKYQLLA